MQTEITWIFAIAIGSLVIAGCGLMAILVFAYRLRRVLRQHRMVLADIVELANPALLSGQIVDLTNMTEHVGGQIAHTRQQLRELTNSLNETKILFGVDRFRASHGTPSDIIIGPTDTYEQLDQNWGSIHEPIGRKMSSAVIAGNRKRTAVFVVVGQSNAANHGAGKYVAKHQVDNFNIYDGQCYHAEDPLLGASGDGGNFATRLGDKVIEAGLFDRVILAPIAMGGTTVEQWAEEGMFNRRIPVLIRRLHDVGLSADFILWQQGEGNPGVGDIKGRQYRKNLLEVIGTFRKYSVNAPFFVSLTTLCGGPHANAENIRAGQKGVVSPAAGIFQGPDTDTIGVEHRWDACHFNEVGLDMAASLWLDVIAAYCRPEQSVKALSSRNDIELVSSG